MILTCPVDQTALRATDRAGIEIDWCPTCRGVWLDRGELDKILQRSATPAASRGPRDRPDDDDRDDDDRDDDDRDLRRRTGRRRGGFLDDLFDFG